MEKLRFIHLYWSESQGSVLLLGLGRVDTFGANEIRKRRPVDQIAGSGINATDTLEL